MLPEGGGEVQAQRSRGHAGLPPGQRGAWGLHCGAGHRRSGSGTLRALPVFPPSLKSLRLCNFSQISGRIEATDEGV